MSALAERGAALLGGTLARASFLSGGSLSQIVRIALADGREAIVKTGPAPRTEANMLRAIAASGAPAPSVLAVDDDVLVIACLTEESGPAGAWADLGTQLTRLHALQSERYGWHEDYAFGGLRIENGWSSDWPSFWAERRLLAHLPHLPVDLGRRLEALARGLPDRLPARPAASLLHGDLWGGNVLAARGRITGLIDPACYYGHAEVDLAMLGLFDHPPPDFFEAYGVPEQGRAERRPIYALWPALVHLRLFGSGYRAMVAGLMSEIGFPA